MKQLTTGTRVARAHVKTAAKILRRNGLKVGKVPDHLVASLGSAIDEVIPQAIADCACDLVKLGGYEPPKATPVANLNDLLHKVP